MKMLHDIWYNWFEGVENPHLVPEYFSWYKDDEVGLMDQIPLIKVNDNLYNYIEFGLRKIPKEVLYDVFNKAYLKLNHDKLLIKYAFVVTDGSRVIMIQADEYGRVEKKSRLIIRQHILALEMVENEKVDYVLESKVDVSRFPIYAGRTRKEKHHQIIATDFINKLSSDKLGLLKYLVAEWDLNLHKNIPDTFNDIKHRFLDEIKMSEVGRLISFNKVIGKIKLNN